MISPIRMAIGRRWSWGVPSGRSEYENSGNRALALADEALNLARPGRGDKGDLDLTPVFRNNRLSVGFGNSDVPPSEAEPLKRALISDIHSNIEALRAVLDDIPRPGSDGNLLSGDVVGYGPNPGECIDEVMKADVCLLGNHDQGALFDPEGFNTGAERAIFWTRSQLENYSPSSNDGVRRWEFLGRTAT